MGAEREGMGGLWGGDVTLAWVPRLPPCTCHHSANILAVSQEFTLVSFLQNATSELPVTTVPRPGREQDRASGTPDEAAERGRGMQ